MPDVTPRRLILTLYGLYARDEHNWLSVRSVVKLMEDLGIDSPGVRSSISRLKRRGVLDPMKVDAAAGYSLSDEALEVLREGDVRIFGPKRSTEADGLVMVAFSVPESERERRHQLRTVLSGLGFGTVSPGLWVAPSVLYDETVRILDHRGLAPYVEVFRATYENFGTLRRSRSHVVGPQLDSGRVPRLRHHLRTRQDFLEVHLEGPSARVRQLRADADGLAPPPRT